MAVLELPEVKTHLNITVATFDAQLNPLITAAQAAIAERVGPLEPESRTVRVTPYGASLFVPSPAVELTSITNSSGTELTVADLHLETRSGLVTHNAGQAFTTGWYDVTYLWGREECPADLVLAVKEMVRHLWNSSQRNPTRRPGSTDGETTANTIPGAAYLLPFRVAELIAPHRPQLVG